MQSLDLLAQLADSEHNDRLRRAALRRLSAERLRALTTPHPLEPAELPASWGERTPAWWPALEAGVYAEAPPVPVRVRGGHRRSEPLPVAGETLAVCACEDAGTPRP